MIIANHGTVENIRAKKDDNDNEWGYANRLVELAGRIAEAVESRT